MYTDKTIISKANKLKEMLEDFKKFSNDFEKQEGVTILTSVGEDYADYLCGELEHIICLCTVPTPLED